MERVVTPLTAWQSFICNLITFFVVAALLMVGFNYSAWLVPVLPQHVDYGTACAVLLFVRMLRIAFRPWLNATK